MAVIMGTAGHIDHGKTSLIKALTGIDCDRLEEEKRRGITIELGFAFLDLPDGERLGIVDVPGHERFVKTMVAGAAGIDFVLLVIAADEGVMPQTREHLDICSLLGIRSGLVALTKTDLVDREWLSLVGDEVCGFLAGTFLEGAPVCPVSVRTGDGLSDLSGRLAALAGHCGSSRRSDLARLPVDRVFTMRGHGTVVTGTLVSGRLALGEEVVLYPTGVKSKVRGLQSHGQSVAEALAGRRVAINLAGLEVGDVERGQVLGRPGELFPVEAWDVELTCLASDVKALRHRTEIHFHHGTKETLARLHLLDRDELRPGETALCQIRFREPMTGVFGDRFVARAFSPLRTVAGGRIINPMGRRIRRRSQGLEGLAALASGAGSDVVRTQLILAGMEGLSVARLRVMTNLESRRLDAALQELSGKREVFLFDREERAYVAAETVQDMAEQACAHLDGLHRREPLKEGMPRGALTAAWSAQMSPRLGHFLVEHMIRQGMMESVGDAVRLSGHAVSLAADQVGMRDRLLAVYRQGGRTPPNLKDARMAARVEAKEAAALLKILQAEGQLVKVSEDLFFHAPVLEELKAQAVAFLERTGEMGPGEFRELTGLSRKYLIALLEHFDREKLTVRAGDKRRLRKKGM